MKPDPTNWTLIATLAVLILFSLWTAYERDIEHKERQQQINRLGDLTWRLERAVDLVD